MMQTSKEYAEALFSLAEESQSRAEYADALNMIRELMKANPAYIELLASPAISLAERVQLINEAFRQDFPEHVVSFLKILCENGYIRSVFSCIEEFEKLVMAASNRAAAVISSAVELSEKQKEAIRTKLEKLTGKTVEPVYTVDELLLGGIKIEIEGKVYDGSVKQRLYEVKEVMIR